MPVSKIPSEFVKQLVDLNWREIKFGLDHQLIDSAAAIDRATESLCRNEPAAKAEVELAGLSHDEPVSELVDQLAQKEPEVGEEALREKWVYVVLAWLFENRSSFGSPLELVEEIYADFGYPREVAPFVRYMPMAGPDLGNREKNEARLYDYWRDYLDRARVHLGRATSA
ncbi:hypothetical protein GALL_141120 [mine drainage metagenome]|uniref:DUF2247 domain-containing protein n=1 Tax=mine drainage metagenome TaxID=410659 RepID=A0A1J5S5Y4_9ZZZZ